MEEKRKNTGKKRRKTTKFYWDEGGNILGTVASKGKLQGK